MKKYHWMIAILVLAMSSQPALAAKLYKWVDEYGNVTYRDLPPSEVGAEYTEQDISGGSGSGSESDELAEIAERNPVVLYSVPGCVACDSARSYLQSRNIPFQDKNVKNNGKLQQELKKKSGEVSVPTVTIGPKVLSGYLQSLLKGELDAAGYPPIAGEDSAGEATGQYVDEPEEKDE